MYFKVLDCGKVEFYTTEGHKVDSVVEFSIPPTTLEDIPVMYLKVYLAPTPK